MTTKHKLLNNIRKIAVLDINTQHSKNIEGILADEGMCKTLKKNIVVNHLNDRDENIKYLDEAIEYVKSKDTSSIRSGLTLIEISKFESWKILMYTYYILDILDKINVENKDV